MWLFCYFNFERNYDVLKSKSAGILLNKNINFNKKETESKTENHTYTVLERRTFYGAISNPDVPCSKPLGGSKVDSPFHLSEFNKRSISFFIKFFFLNIYKNHKLKPRWVRAHASKKRGFFVLFVRRKYFSHLCFMSMYSVLNTLAEYTIFYISKNNTSCTFLLVFKIWESLQCILNTDCRFFCEQVVLCRLLWIYI